MAVSLEIFAAEPVCTTMVSAPSKAQAAADFVTDAIEEDGLLHAFERLGLV
jgi:hydroxymethylpyrimidine pyrophosphatase-like HAD family hydrolase